MVSNGPNLSLRDAGRFETPLPGNHALRDYQMQIMFLEQQGKKRALMAQHDSIHSAAKERSL